MTAAKVLALASATELITELLAQYETDPDRTVLIDDVERGHRDLVGSETHHVTLTMRSGIKLRVTVAIA